jgi:hypothetical protein
VQSKAKSILVAIVLGVGISALLQVLALVAHEHGFASITRIVDWPNTLLQSLVPCVPVGSSETPRCEGSPLNLLAYFASLPVGAVVYSTIAFVILKRVRHVA